MHILPAVASLTVAEPRLTAPEANISITVSVVPHITGVPSERPVSAATSAVIASIISV